MIGLMRQSPFTAGALPTRAFHKKKKTEAPKRPNQEIVVKMVPFIPPDQIRETFKFLNSKGTQTSLLEIIFHPTPEQASGIPETARLEFQRKSEEFEFKKAEFFRDFRRHEDDARKAMWNAVQELPEDLYDEAAASEWSSPPKDILHSQRYKDQLYIGNPKYNIPAPQLSEEELRKLQIYQNVMYVRFPHAAMKEQKPEKFWIRDTLAVSRQKEAANRARTIKKKK